MKKIVFFTLIADNLYRFSKKIINAKNVFYLFALILCIGFSLTSAAQVNSNIQTPTSINEDGTAPDASAMLDINASGKGVLISRMTLKVSQSTLPDLPFRSLRGYVSARPLSPLKRWRLTRVGTISAKPVASVMAPSNTSKLLTKTLRNSTISLWIPTN